MKSTLGIALLVAALCSTAHAEDPSGATPTKFVASIDTWKGASYRVELARDGTIEYSDNFSPPATRRIHIRVPLNRWLAFRRHLDAAKVWSWHRQYIDVAVADGRGWSLEVVYLDRKMTSSGSNAYPPKKQFEEFRAAVRELTGGKRRGGGERLVIRGSREVYASIVRDGKPTRMSAGREKIDLWIMPVDFRPRLPGFFEHLQLALYPSPPSFAATGRDIRVYAYGAAHYTSWPTWETDLIRALHLRRDKL